MLDLEITCKALKTPYKPLLDYAMTYVSLSKKELQCVNMCIVEDMTEEEVAEEIQKSRDYVAKHKKSGETKIRQAWEYCPIIEILNKY